MSDAKRLISMDMIKIRVDMKPKSRNPAKRDEFDYHRLMLRSESKNKQSGFYNIEK